MSYIEVQCPATDEDTHGRTRFNPQTLHSTFFKIEKYHVQDGMLTIEHVNGTKSFVVLGKGYSVREHIA